LPTSICKIRNFPEVIHLDPAKRGRDKEIGKGKGRGRGRGKGRGR